MFQIHPARFAAAQLAFIYGGASLLVLPAWTIPQFSELRPMWDATGNNSRLMWHGTDMEYWYGAGMSLCFIGVIVVCYAIIIIRLRSIRQKTEPGNGSQGQMPIGERNAFVQGILMALMELHITLVFAFAPVVKMYTDRIYAIVWLKVAEWIEFFSIPFIFISLSPSIRGMLKPRCARNAVVPTIRIDTINPVGSNVDTSAPQNNNPADTK